MSTEKPIGPQEAWIDVGGTFTDCYVLGYGLKRSRVKVLSSGLVPIACEFDADQQHFSSDQLKEDCDQFWSNAQLRCLDSAGNLIDSAEIVDFRSDGERGRIATARSLNFSGQTRAKLSFEISSGLEAPVLAVRRAINRPLTESIGPISVRLGTTRGTNALLTRRGAPTALAITAPFVDLLHIGDQTRPKLFEVAIQRDEPLVHLTIPIPERLDASGGVVIPLDEREARSQLRAALDRGMESLAICLMHSYRNPVHEFSLEKIAREIGFSHVSRSSALAPLIEIVSRARTTVVDAYLAPILREYLARLVDQFGGPQNVRLEVMTSAGGLVAWAEMAGKDSILSGPAGGVVALKALGAAAREPHLIGLDMGGTSTDVCRTAPDLSLQYESTKAGVRIFTPTLPIETVASGGGSLCWFDGVSLRVGPQSAGAMPGPACYGRGGPLTITDLNCFLGRLPASQFPFPLDLAATKRRLQELFDQMELAGVRFESLEHLADGLRAIANQQMAEAVRTVSIAQGADPRKHTLVGFGGAAGQHICEIADLLGMQRIFDSAEAGLFSALGMGLASLRRDGTLPIYRVLAQVDVDELVERSQRLAKDLQQDWTRSMASSAIETLFEAELRYEGTDVTLTVPLELTTHAWQCLTEQFSAKHLKRFGYVRSHRAIELVAIRVECTLPSLSQMDDACCVDQAVSPAVGDLCEQVQALWSRGVCSQVPTVSRARIPLGSQLCGPLIVLSPGSTLVVDEGWHARALSDGTLAIERNSARIASAALFNKVTDGEAGDRSVDLVTEAVFAQRLAAIATQMGLVLQQTALSVNVKQRRDYSCAVFDCSGRMLASAPHVPVHLGAMGATVRAAMKRFPQWSSGDVVITNDPYQGGSHLPDVTVISGVFAPGEPSPRLYVANRAHHADIGGVTPGSMSVVATRLGQEGAIIQPLLISAAQCDDLDPLCRVLSSSLWPPRNIEENLADIRAQLAANSRGIALIEDLQKSFGWDEMARCSDAVLLVARSRVQNFVSSLKTLPEGESRRFVDAMDDGTPICVKIDVAEGNRLRIDFGGSGTTSPTNFNANPSIVTAAIIYVLRTLINDDLPLNEGMMAAIDLVVPPGILNPSMAAEIADSPAVAAGNVETSQRIVDVLLGAFGAASASQGTMNNLLFGNERFGFYETICGGAGATKGCAGASGVHTHMTNTRLTDPEILEAKYPARLLRFGLRPGSGGNGKWKGGDGVIRTIQFSEPVQLSLITSRRGSNCPYALAGGASGLAGINTHIGIDGCRMELPSSCQIEVKAGESIEIQTPGGGGYGSP